MIALFVAISGVATAGNNKTVKLPANSVGSAQIKKSAVKSSDLAKKAVTASTIATNAITPRSILPESITSTALAPGAVTETELATNAVPPRALQTVPGDKIEPFSIGSGQIKNDAVIHRTIDALAVLDRNIGIDAITAEKLADGSVNSNNLADDSVTYEKIEFFPGAKATASNVTMNFPLPGTSCSIRSPGVPFGATDWNLFSVFDIGSPDRLTATVAGVYSISADATWAAGGGTLRSIQVNKITGSGPNAGLTTRLLYTVATPDGLSPTYQNVSFDAKLAAGDYLHLVPGTCGANVNVSGASMSMKWIGDA